MTKVISIISAALFITMGIASAATHSKGIDPGPFVLGLIAFYFLPSMFAFFRGHVQKNAILLINILFGWTLLGWLIALIWSATYSPAQPKVKKDWTYSGF